MKAKKQKQETFEFTKDDFNFYMETVYKTIVQIFEKRPANKIELKFIKNFLGQATDDFFVLTAMQAKYVYGLIKKEVEKEKQNTNPDILKPIKISKKKTIKK